MITIVGRKIFFILLSCIFLSTFPATINLKLTTLEGAVLHQAGVGQPFLLNVIVTDTSNSAQYPALKGIDNLHVRQSGFQMNMVNGATSITYHYRVRIDTPGEYTLGPATIVEGNNTIESDPIKVTVGDQQKSNAPRNQKTGSVPTVTLTCDKTDVYVGQTVNAQLSFYTADPTTILQTIVEPEQVASSGLAFKNKQNNQPATGTETINGVEYRFAKWNFQIVPTKPGSLVIPAYTAQYTNQSNQPMLSFFFHNDTKRAYSKPVTLEVHQLPPSQKTPAFIGTIQQIQAQINPSQARVGQGIVYALVLSGDGDFEAMHMPALAMPTECKWYESKKYYGPSSNGAHTFVMEYIIQALQPGLITIPSQDVYYFDTSAKQYKTTSTRPITFEVTGSPIPQESAPIIPDEQITSTIDSLAPLQKDGPIEQAPIHFIPWYLFWALLSLLTVLWLVCILVSMNKNLLQNLVTLFKKRSSPYDQARLAVKNAYEQKNYSAYYRYLNELFAARLNVAPAQLTPELIENSLRQDGLSAQAIQDWRDFYAEISQMSFYKAELDQAYYKQITQKVYYWIDVLKQLPRVHL